MASDVQIIARGAKKAGRAISDREIVIGVIIVIMSFIMGGIVAAVDDVRPPEYMVYVTEGGYDKVFKKDNNGEWQLDNTGITLKTKGM